MKITPITPKITFLHITLLVIFSLIVSVVVFYDQIVGGILIVNENNMYRNHYVVGPFSLFRDNSSLFWLPNHSFGSPRLAVPLFYSFSPVAYLGRFIDEPLNGYFLWVSSTALGIWGGYHFFKLITTSNVSAFWASCVFALSGALFGSALIGLYAEKIFLVPWVLYFFWQGLKNRHHISIVIAAGIHALHFNTGASYLWFYVSTGIALFILGYFYTIYTKDQDFKTVWCRIFKDSVNFGFTFFIPCGLLIVGMVIPIAEYGPYAVHRELSDAAYANTGRFDPREIFKAPFWFPYILGYSRQFNAFANVSYLGWLPTFLFFLWVRTAEKRNVIKILILLGITFMAAASKAPVDTLMRLMPAMSEVRYSVYWLTAYNIVLLVISLKVLDQLDKSISYQKAFLESVFLFSITIVALILLFTFLDIKDYSYLFRPIFPALAVVVFLKLAEKQKIVKIPLIVMFCLIATLDMVIWTKQITGNEVGVKSNNEAFINDLHRDASYQNIFSPQLGSGRGFLFSNGKGQSERLSINGANVEWAIWGSPYPLKRAYEMSKFLGWNEGSSRGMYGIEAPARKYLMGAWLNWARALNIRYYFLDSHDDQEFAESIGFQKKSIKENHGFSIYEDPFALQRVKFYSDVEYVKDFQDALSALNSELNPMKRLIVETDQKMFTSTASPNLNDGKEFEPAPRSQVSVETYTPIQIDIKVSTPTSGFLAVSDMPYPGWTVSIDGAPQEIYPANIVGRGVYITPGEHNVSFTYSPKKTIAALIVNGISALMFLVFMVFWGLRRQSAQ